MPRHMRVPKRCGVCAYFGGGVDFAPQWGTYRPIYDEAGRLVGCTWRNVAVHPSHRPGRACPLVARRDSD